MNVPELVERLNALEHERPGVMTIKHKDDGSALVRCTSGTLVELMIRVLDTPDECTEHTHWLWQHLKDAAPLPAAGVIFEALRRQAQGLAGESMQETAGSYLEQSELIIERRRGRQA